MPSLLRRDDTIDSKHYLKESANRVSDLIEDFYAASFTQKGVSYAHLNDIAETEALLQRPEYTWISTVRFRSAFAFPRNDGFDRTRRTQKSSQGSAA